MILSAQIKFSRYASAHKSLTLTAPLRRRNPEPGEEGGGGGGGGGGQNPSNRGHYICIKHAEFLLDTPPILFTFLRFCNNKRFAR